MCIQTVSTLYDQLMEAAGSRVKNIANASQLHTKEAWNFRIWLKIINSQFPHQPEKIQSTWVAFLAQQAETFLLAYKQFLQKWGLSGCWQTWVVESKYCEILFLSLASWDFSESELLSQRLVRGYMACDMQWGIPRQIGECFCLFYPDLRFKRRECMKGL